MLDGVLITKPDISITVAPIVPCINQVLVLLVVIEIFGKSEYMDDIKATLTHLHKTKHPENVSGDVTFVTPIK